MGEENIRLRKIVDTRNYFLKEVERDKLMSKNHKKVCTTLNYVKHFLILAYTIIICI